MKYEQNKLSIMTDSRSIVVSDIHGCAKTFKRLIVEVVCLKKSDTLYMLGDMIDRGPDSKGVIDTILELQSSGYDVRPIRGNHEQMLLSSINAPLYKDQVLWLANGGCATMESYGVTEPEELGELIKFLEALPLYLTTDSHVFVHAGLDFRLNDPFSGEVAMLWKRSGGINEAKLNSKVLVTGHTPLTLSKIRSSLSTSHIRLDNGCVQGGAVRGVGNLVALELKNSVLHVQRNIE